MTATFEALTDRRGHPMEAVVTSDGAAWTWSDLFTHFAPAIHSFARSRGVSSPEDVVQDVFAAAVERFPRFEGDSSGLRSFLFTLAYRRIADEHRVSYRRREQLVADHQPAPDDSPGVEDSITAREDAGEAMQALDILDARERRVIEMRIIQEATPAQVADALGLSNGNVRVIQARALMKVRKHLAAQTGAAPSFGLVFAFLKGLRSDLPADGGIAEWIEMLRSASTRSTLETAASGSGSVAAVEAASLASTGTIAGTLLKVGLAVALATTSSSAVETDTAASGRPNLAAVPSIALVEEPMESARVNPVPPQVFDEPTPGAAIGLNAPNRADPVPPTRQSPEAPVTRPDQTASADPEDQVAGDSTDTGGEGSSQPVTGAVLEPVVQDVVEPLVDQVVDVVDGLVDDVVKPVVDGVVDDIVQPVVNDVVMPVVDDTTQTASDTVDVVVDSVDTVVDTVDSVVGNLTDTLRLGKLAG